MQTPSRSLHDLHPLRLLPLGTVFLEAAPAEKQKDASGGVQQ